MTRRFPNDSLTIATIHDSPKIGFDDAYATSAYIPLTLSCGYPHPMDANICLLILP